MLQKVFLKRWDTAQGSLDGAWEAELGGQSVHQSLGPGEQASAAGETVEVKGCLGKGREGEEGPQKRRRAMKTDLASSPPVNSGFLEAQALGRKSHPLFPWLLPDLACQPKLSLVQKCYPCFWAQVPQNQRPPLKDSNRVLIC